MKTKSIAVLIGLVLLGVLIFAVRKEKDPALESTNKTSSMPIPQEAPDKSESKKLPIVRGEPEGEEEILMVEDPLEDPIEDEQVQIPDTQPLENELSAEEAQEQADQISEEARQLIRSRYPERESEPVGR